MVKTTNIRRILDRVKRQKMLLDIPFETAVEYTVDFIELIGTPGLYEEKTAVVRVKDWQGELPCDFEHMIQVRIAPNQKTPLSSGRLPGTGTYRYSEHTFHMSPSKPHAELTGTLTYKLQGRTIFTSTRNIDVEIAYNAFMVDDEGYPLLPDNASFLRGLEAYIKMKWFEMKFDEGAISQAVMDRAEQQYCWAVGDAEAEFSRLSIDEAETLFNSFKTLLPRNNEHWKEFFTMGSREVMR